MTLFPASRLRHRLILEEQSLASDDMGGFDRTWEEVATLWADIEPLNGREKLENRQLQSSNLFKIRLRYRGNIVPAMRFVYGEKVFNIRSVINLKERNEMLEIVAEEGVAI